MRTFDDYYNKNLKEIRLCSKRDKVSVEYFIEKHYYKSLSEYKEWIKSHYEGKDCHSFWHRECVNKGIKCNDCIKFYSISEWDKMTIKQKNIIKKS